MKGGHSQQVSSHNVRHTKGCTGKCTGGSWLPHLVKAAMLALGADVVDKAHNPVGG